MNDFQDFGILTNVKTCLSLDASVGSGTACVNVPESDSERPCVGRQPKLDNHCYYIHNKVLGPSNNSGMYSSCAFFNIRFLDETEQIHVTHVSRYKNYV